MINQGLPCAILYIYLFVGKSSTSRLNHEVNGGVREVTLSMNLTQLHRPLKQAGVTNQRG